MDVVLSMILPITGCQKFFIIVIHYMQSHIYECKCVCTYLCVFVYLLFLNIQSFH